VIQPKNIGKEKALQKIRQYCAYQERNHREVKEKLYSFGLYKEEVETLVSQMIEENYLNEERYAVIFAGGKFRMKGWGKAKIKYALKQDGVSEFCIKKALSSIAEEAYQEKLLEIFEKKIQVLKTEKNLFTKKKKLQSYLLQKGYEGERVGKLLAKL
jgi:regulatory protein